MIFHKLIESAWRGRLFGRCDDTGLVKYFAHTDFPGLAAESYPFKSSHGHDLQGYFYTYAGYDPDRLVVFDHGFGGGHRSYMKEIERLCAAGYRVFAYDHTGCMESGGAGANGFTQSLCDLDDCLKTLKADSTVNTADISVMGHSWGGYSTLNIAALHPDVRRIAVLAGPISTDRMVEQNFAGSLKGYRRHILDLEAAANPGYVRADATVTLRHADTRALLIYSDNDPLVRMDMHYDTLYSALMDCDRVEFLLESGKGHNPNYTADAVAYLAELGEATKKASKLKTAAEREHFRNSFDWERMTAQDEAVWARILSFLAK